jgi:hypothetical protein
MGAVSEKYHEKGCHSDEQTAKKYPLPELPFLYLGWQ